MEADKVVHSGLLMVPPNGKLILKKTWQQKFCLLYKASKFGIERLEVYDNIDEVKSPKASPCKIITLENCVKVSKRGHTFLTIVTKSGSYEFAATTEAILEEWIGALQSVAFRDDTSRITTLVEDNDLYCSVGEGVFNVTLHETEASLRCCLETKSYLLVLTSTAIQLKEAGSENLLFTWPYQFIRRYGYSNGKFTFEAGRKCESGEGKFLLQHSNEQEIFRYLTMKMKSMKQLLKSDSVSSLDCGDKQFAAMLSMEARSRSPLPPSPTTSTSLHDIENLSMDLSEKLLKVNKDVKRGAPLPPPKPPRKHPGAKDASKDDYEFINRYDEIEYRSNAWQTLGTTEVDHSENVEEQEVSRQRVPVVGDSQTSVFRAAKVITDPDSDNDSYDKLNFLGSTSKLNTYGYKQMRANSNASAAPVIPKFNEYDEVHLSDIRSADDSHLGYAVVRKKESQVDHKSINDTEYAIISKPKRV